MGGGEGEREGQGGWAREGGLREHGRRVGRGYRRAESLGGSWGCSVAQYTVVTIHSIKRT